MVTGVPLKDYFCSEFDANHFPMKTNSRETPLLLPFASIRYLLHTQNRKKTTHLAGILKPVCDYISMHKDLQGF